MIRLDPTPLPAVPAVESWAQAAVTIVLILAVLVVPSALSYLSTKQARRAGDAAEETRRTLQENNGGSTVRDSLDRIEGSITALTARVSALEAQGKKKRSMRP